MIISFNSLHSICVSKLKGEHPIDHGELQRFYEQMMTVSKSYLTQQPSIELQQLLDKFPQSLNLSYAFTGCVGKLRQAVLVLILPIVMLLEFYIPMLGLSLSVLWFVVVIGIQLIYSRKEKVVHEQLLEIEKLTKEAVVLLRQQQNSGLT